MARCFLSLSLAALLPLTAPAAVKEPPFAEAAKHASPLHFSKHWFGKRPGAFAKESIFLSHHIFSISFNAERGFPDYAAYTLNPGIVFGRLKADRSLKADPLLQQALKHIPGAKAPLSSKDYKGAARFGYDRGHLAPKGSFKGSLYGFEAQYMSNIVPQNRDLNQGPWRVLEEKIRSFTLQGYEVKVLAGPVYGSPYQGQKAYKKKFPPWPAAVGKISEAPSGFWKMIFYKGGGALKICALLMPQDLHGLGRRARVKKFIVSLKDLLPYIPLDSPLKSAGGRGAETCKFLKL